MSEGGAYSYKSFTASLRLKAPAAAPIFKVIANDRGKERWSRLVETAKSLGADVKLNQPPDFNLRLASTLALVKSSFADINGAGEKDGGFYVLFPEPCAPFDTETFIEEVDGINPMAEPLGYFEHMRDACAAGKTISAKLRVGEMVKETMLKCTLSVEQPMPIILVK